MSEPTGHSIRFPAHQEGDSCLGALPAIPIESWRVDHNVSNRREASSRIGPRPQLPVQAIRTAQLIIEYEVIGYEVYSPIPWTGKRMSLYCGAVLA